MNSNSQPKTTVAVYLAGFIGTFLIMIGLIALMYYYTRPPGVDEVRASERRKNLADLQAANKELLEHYGWVDQGKGIVRLPIERAMKLTVLESQDQPVARSNLLVNLEKLLAVPPPKPEPSNK
ncbi:MAG: hypothetical protein M1608_05025 [Candidatus Omnitrophica bacterium]|nr:hypothetical protein [Candidatus Omnitrophota bacterium]